MDPYHLGETGLAEALAQLPAPAGPQPAYRARQIQAWLARGVDEPEAMTDLPKALRSALSQRLDPRPAQVAQTASDGGHTQKVLLQLPDGEAIEAVTMCYPRTSARAGRATVCISTQAGCALGCPFCATGQAGLRRQLATGEIARQVTVAQRLLAEGGVAAEGVPDHVTNVVFMGMGEPLANLGPTTEALRWLTDPSGFGLSARSVTLSTVGIVPGVYRLASLELPLTLAVSLHAPTDELRDEIVPINRTYPLADLMEACRAYRATTGRRITFEYILIAGVNDELANAGRLAELIGDTDAHVNLIPMNPTPGIGWDAPSEQHQRAFTDALGAHGVAATLRRNRGSDIDAACGQLYANYRAGSGRRLPSARLPAADGDTSPLGPAHGQPAGAGERS
jgi:23S rRNA (adenine2503-C2)-methyltransferase